MAKPNHRFVKVIDPFFLNRELIAKLGEVHELPRSLATEVVSANKAVFTTDPADALVASANAEKTGKKQSP